MIEVPENTLGARIRKVRGSITQEDFGKRLNVSRSTVASWECNANQPSIAILRIIAKMGTVSMDWLTCHDAPHNYAAETIYHNPSWHEFLSLVAEKNINPRRLTRIVTDSLHINSRDQ